MRKITLLALSLMLSIVCSVNAQTTYYVSASGDNSDGLSLSTAFNTINPAYDAAADGDKIIIDGTVSQTSQLIVAKSLNFEGQNSASLNNAGGTNRMINVDLTGIDLSFKNITFEDSVNTAAAGGVMSIASVEFVSFDGCIFQNNSTATASGGALNLNNVVSAIITGCTFTNNTAGDNGGAVSRTGSGVLMVTNSLFNGNQANGTNGNGGGISHNNNGNINVSYTTFYNNSAALQGGAIFIGGNGSTSQLKNITAFGNSIGVPNVDRAGGVRIEGAKPFTIENALIYGNTASGGAVSDLGVIPNVVLTMINTLSGGAVPVLPNDGGGASSPDTITASNIAADLASSNLMFNAGSGVVEFVVATAGQSPIDYGADGNDVGAWDSGLTQPSLSISTKELESQLLIHHDRLSKTIKVKNIINEQVSLDVYNLLGSKVISANNIGKEFNIDSSALQSGVYIIKARTLLTNRIISKKFVVSN